MRKCPICGKYIKSLGIASHPPDGGLRSVLERVADLITTRNYLLAEATARNALAGERHAPGCGYFQDESPCTCGMDAGEEVSRESK